MYQNDNLLKNMQFILFKFSSALELKLEKIIIYHVIVQNKQIIEEEKEERSYNQSHGSIEERKPMDNVMSDGERRGKKICPCSLFPSNGASSM